jgi:hypothetical protein
LESDLIQGDRVFQAPCQGNVRNFVTLCIL